MTRQQDQDIREAPSHDGGTEMKLRVRELKCKTITYIGDQKNFGNLVVAPKLIIHECLFQKLAAYKANVRCDQQGQGIDLVCLVIIYFLHYFRNRHDCANGTHHTHE